MSRKCEKLHIWFNSLPKHYFPFNEDKIPLNGIYILFEKGERAHNTIRVVRIGTHTGKDQLRSRLIQHFIDENKDRSILRKNIGRCILNRENDPFLQQWEIDLTTRDSRRKYQHNIDLKKREDIEREVTKYIQKNFSFVVFKVDNKNSRLDLESKIISTISLCDGCIPSKTWFGNYSPKEKIRESGLWLVNKLYQESLTENDMSKLQNLLRSRTFK